MKKRTESLFSFSFSFALNYHLVYNEKNYNYSRGAMNIKIQEMLDFLIEYSENNREVLIAAGGVLLIFLLCVVLVKSTRERKAMEKKETPAPLLEEPKDFVEKAEVLLEGELEAALENETEKVLVEDVVDATIWAEPEEEPEPVEILQSLDIPATAPKEETSPEVVVDETTMRLLEVVSGLDKVPVKNLKSIELKIDHAKLTINYSQEEAEELVVETTEEEKQGVEEAVEDMVDEVPAEDFPKTGTVKKFGGSNMNTTRSGRTYTEEELYQQIKD